MLPDLVNVIPALNHGLQHEHFPQQEKKEASEMKEGRILEENLLHTACVRWFNFQYIGDLKHSAKASDKCLRKSGE